jgi:hypothetical protein
MFSHRIDQKRQLKFCSQNLPCMQTDCARCCGIQHVKIWCKRSATLSACWNLVTYITICLSSLNYSISSLDCLIGRTALESVLVVAWHVTRGQQSQRESCRNHGIRINGVYPIWAAMQPATRRTSGVSNWSFTWETIFWKKISVKNPRMFSTIAQCTRN